MERYLRCNGLPVLLLYNIDPTWPDEDIENSVYETQVLSGALAELGHPLREVCVQSADLEGYLREYPPQDYVVFNWCEELPGIPRSAAQAAAILERLGYSFTGADEQGLLLGQDKRRVKRLLKQHGVPTPNWQVYESSANVHWERFPAIVKPAFEHCGFGISRQSVVYTDLEIEQRVQAVFDEFGEPAIVEDFIDGREFHIGVLGNAELTALPPAEIDYSRFEDIHDRLCTYEANFDKNSLAYQMTIPIVPAELSGDELSRLEQTVLAAYRITGCRDYARMDVRLQEGVFYVLDVNHNADISHDNSIVKAAGLLGYSHGQLASLLVNLAAQRHPLWSRTHRQTEGEAER